MLTGVTEWIIECSKGDRTFHLTRKFAKYGSTQKFQEVPETNKKPLSPQAHISLDCWETFLGQASCLQEAETNLDGTWKRAESNWPTRGGHFLICWATCMFSVLQVSSFHEPSPHAEVRYWWCNWLGDHSACHAWVCHVCSHFNLSTTLPSSTHYSKIK